MTTEAQVEVVGQDAAAALAPEDARKSVGTRILDNVKSGNLGILPIGIGLVLIVVFFSFKATNFFTADNFNNIIVQMAGLTMLAFGVVFVLLLGEIDLSIGYLSGIAALAVAEFQLPGSSHQYPGVIAIAIAIGLCAFIGGVQGSVVALVGVPSFIVTLAGLLIWQGVILQVLEVRGVIVIQNNLINDLANYYFTASDGWIIAAVVTGLYAIGTLAGVIGKRRAGVAIRRPLLIVAKVVAVAIACFVTVAISNHAHVPKGLPLAGVLVVVFLIGLTFLAKRTSFGRHVYAVGGNAEAARRAGINVARIRIIGRRRDPGRAAELRRPQRRRRHAAPRRDLRGGHRRHEPLRRPGRGAQRGDRCTRDRDGLERPRHGGLQDRDDLHRDRRHPSPRRHARHDRAPAAGSVRPLTPQRAVPAK